MGKAPVRQRLLQAAAELFYRDGVGATGIDAITAHAGVARMSLYNNFSSKADLVTAYIDGRRTEWHAHLDERMKKAPGPRERLLAVFDSYLDHAARAYDGGFRGCGLLNAAAELPRGDPGRASVAAQKDEVEALFRTCLSEMSCPAHAIYDHAEHLSFLLEGAMARSGLEGHDARLKSARRMAIALLDRIEDPR